MAKENTIRQENFDMLLDWLDRNREVAGIKYEKIRRRLIRIFASRGCFEAEELADQTINRVILKIPKIIEDYIGEPVTYFYGVANNIYHEWLRDQKKKNYLTIPENENHYEPDSEIEFDCLENCLAALADKQRELIIKYYNQEKGAKIELRKSLAENLGISLNALQIKTHRIRSGLQECVRNCVSGKRI